MKTLTAFFLCLVLSVLPAHAGDQEKIYVASLFPVGILLQEVTRDVPDIRVELLLPSNTGCPHDYSMTPQDRHTLARADVLVLNGLGLESFLGEGSRLKSLLKPDASIVDSSLGLTGLIEEEEDHGDMHGHGPNPHIFASPSMAAQMVRSMADQLSTLDPVHADLYRKNAERAAGSLETLAEECRGLGERLKVRRVVTQHDIFAYLARDLGLTVEARIQPHEGQEPSAYEMLDLVRMIRAKNIGAVITEPQYPVRTGQTLAAETGIPCFSLDPVDHGPDDASLDYYGRVMRDNLKTLEKNLGTR